MKIPVLLLVYSRPRETKKLLDQLTKFNVENIFISSDGPKKNMKNNKLFKETQTIIKNLDFKKVKIRTLKKNYGCKLAVMKGIDWFFSHVDQGIILEDDCIPNKSFFLFCKKMLKKYKNTKVKVISGNNFLENKIKIKNHYYFSRFNHCWGWATWKDAWKLYDPDLKNWNKFKKTSYWNKFFVREIDKRYWEKIFNLSKKNYFDSWAYPWLYSIWLNKGYTVIPKYNLVKNIGFEGTHNSFYSRFDFDTKRLNPNFKHPKNIKILEIADDFVMKNFFKPNNFLWPTRILYLIKMFFFNPFIFIKMILKKLK